MKKKTLERALNPHLIFLFLIFLLFLALTVACAREGDPMAAVAWGIFASFPLVCVLLSPLYYCFHSECVTIVYCLGGREVIPWDQVRSVTLTGSWLRKGGGLPCYEIFYSHRKQLPFFYRGEIAKSRKTKRLLEHYCKKRIGESQ